MSVGGLIGRGGFSCYLATQSKVTQRQILRQRLPSHAFSGNVQGYLNGSSALTTPGLGVRVFSQLTSAQARLRPTASEKTKALFEKMSATPTQLTPSGEMIDALKSLSPLEREIISRINTSHMSVGALSLRVKQVMAEASSIIKQVLGTDGPHVGSGEGGQNWSGSSAATDVQIAQARWGVDLEYVSNAKRVTVKISQGAKPQHGGLLPGFKVDEFIADCRNVNVGTDCESPSQNPDLCSIEDVEQLVYEIKMANPAAEIAFKIVAKEGCEFVAAGLAKVQGLDRIILSGPGGTAATKESFRKDYAEPWHFYLGKVLDIINAQGTLVKVEVDGMIATPEDALIAFAMGASSIGRGTAAMVDGGCIKLNRCHEGDCSVHIAVTDPERVVKYSVPVDQYINAQVKFAKQVAYLANSYSEKEVDAIDQIVGYVSLLSKGEPLKKPDPPLFPIPKEAQFVSKVEKSLIEEIMRNSNRTHFEFDLTQDKSNPRAFLTRLSRYLELDKRFSHVQGVAVHANTLGQGALAFGHRKIELVARQLNSGAGKSNSGSTIACETAGPLVGYGATSGQLFIGRAGNRGLFRLSTENDVTNVVGSFQGVDSLHYMTRGNVLLMGTHYLEALFDLPSSRHALSYPLDIGTNFGASFKGGTVYLPKGLCEEGRRSGEFHNDFLNSRSNQLNSDDINQITRALNDYTQRLPNDPVAQRLNELSEKELRELFQKVTPV